MTNNKIQAYAERIEALMDTLDDVKGDIVDVYLEVKSAQFNPKALRKAISNKRRKTDAAFEAEVDAYSVMIGVALVREEGLSLREAERRTGASKSSIHRALSVPEVSQNGEADVANNASVGGGGVFAPAAAPPANPGAVVTKATTRAAALLGLETPIEDLTHWTDGLAIPEHLRRKA